MEGALASTLPSRAEWINPQNGGFGSQLCPHTDSSALPRSTPLSFSPSVLFHISPCLSSIDLFSLEAAKATERTGNY